jgi:hypothetical protein
MRPSRPTAIGYQQNLTVITEMAVVVGGRATA